MFEQASWKWHFTMSEFSDCPCYGAFEISSYTLKYHMLKNNPVLGLELKLTA